MLSTAAHHHHARRRFGLTEVLLIAGILVLGAFTLFGSGDRPISALLFGTQVASVD